MRHYKQEELYTRCAVIAETVKPIVDTIREYNPRVDELKRVTLEEIMSDINLIKGEFVYEGKNGTEVRIRPPGFTEEGSITGRPGSNRDRWIYFIDLGNSIILVGVNSLGLENSVAGEVIDEVVRAAGLKELDSTEQNVARYMNKRIA